MFCFLARPCIAQRNLKASIQYEVRPAGRSGYVIRRPRCEHRTTVFSVLSVQWCNGGVSCSMKVDHPGMPDMRDDHSFFTTEEESFEIGSRMARDAIDQMLGSKI